MVLTLPELLQECCTRYNFIHYLIPHQSHTNLLAMQVGLMRNNTVVRDEHNQMNITLERMKLRLKTIMAFDLYMSTGPDNEASTSSFKREHCHTVEIEFLGVWWVSNLLQLNLG